VVAFRKPYAVGSMTERGSNKKPEHEVWPEYKKCLQAKDLPKNLTLVSMFKERGVACPQFFSSKGESGEGRRRSVGKEMFASKVGKETQGNDTKMRLGKEMQGNETKMRPGKEIGVKTRKVGGGRSELRDVARRLDFELEQKQKATKEEREEMVKKMVMEYNQKMEEKSKAKVFNNKDKAIKEFDAEKRFIQKFISEEKSKRSKIPVKKNLKGKKLKSFNMAPIPIVAY